MRKILMVSIAVLFLVSAFAAQAMADVIELETIAQRCITSDTPWDNEDGYLVKDDVYILDGAELTISPGVEVKFAEGKGLFVGYKPCNACLPFYPYEFSGTLTAIGTGDVESGGHITFTSNETSPSPGDWGGIIFSEGSTGSTLTYADISYGGGVDYGTAYGFGQADYTSLYVEGDDPSLMNYIEVSDSASKGIVFADATGTIQNSEVHDIEGTAILVAGNDADTTIWDCEIHDNTTETGNNGIGIKILSESGAATIIGGDIYNNNQGVRIHGDQSAQFEMWGTGVTTVQIRDNSLLGIYLNGGTLTIDDTHSQTNGPAAYIYDNGTYGIRLLSGTLNLAGDATDMNNAWINIEDQGSNGGQDYGIYMSGGEVNSTYTNIKYNDIAGIYMTGGELNTSNRTYIAENDHYGVYMTGGELNTDHTEIKDNDQLGVYMSDGEMHMSYTKVYDNSSTGYYVGPNETWYAGIYIEGSDSNSNTFHNSCVYNNNFDENDDYSYEFVTKSPTGYGDVSATSSYWGVTDPTDVERRTHDSAEDDEVATITEWPIITSCPSW